MASATSFFPNISDTKFIRQLLGLWILFTLIFGIFSDWLFVRLVDDHIGFPGEGIIYTSIFTTLLLGFFWMSWRPLHHHFPLQYPKNKWIHACVQVLNLLVGFVLGFMITGFIQIQLYGIDAAPKSAMMVGWTIIAMMCLIGILATNGLFYSRFFMQRSMEAERRLTESELSALRAQINPHFLFNSLNSIAALIRISPEEAESVTQDLADVFRYTLRASEHPLVCLKDELEIIGLYLNIEQARFKDRLSVNIEAPENLHQISIPVLTLQPLVENAIKHGVSQKEGKHEVHLSIKNEQNQIEVRVSDTGPGFPHNDFYKLLNQGTGLSNVFKRLQLHFGEQVDGAISRHELVLRFPNVETGAHAHFEPQNSESAR